MKTLVSAIVLAVTLTQPAAAITFPTLTTIYVGPGVKDDGGAGDAGIATSFLCSNVSGKTADIRFLVLNHSGSVQASRTINTFLHGTAIAVSTHQTMAFAESNLTTGAVFGTVNIEATESGIFCSAMIVEAATASGNLAPLRLIRVNPHPGTVE